MRRRFALPAVIALTVEVVLLLCFNKPAPASAHPPAPPPQTFVIPMDEPVTPSATDDEAGGAPQAARPAPPSLEEPPRISDPGRIPIDAPPVTIHGVVLPDRIEPGAIGPFGGGPGDGPGIIPATLLDNAPRVRLQVPPKYPYEASKYWEGGEVLVEFSVDEGGRVFNPRIVHSSREIFEEPTIRAVSQWRFEPGRRNGKTVRFRMMVPVEFHTDQN